MGLGPGPGFRVRVRARVRVGARDRSVRDCDLRTEVTEIAHAPRHPLAQLDAVALDRGSRVAW